LKENKIGAILVTGGAGFIGSHSTIELLKLGYRVVVIDNFSNSKKDIIKKIKKVSKKTFPFYNCDIRNTPKIIDIIKKNKINIVLHFAGLKSVEESIINEKIYLENNLVGTLKLLNATAATDIKKIIFSSSATVYDSKNKAPFSEEDKLYPISPYGKSKEIIEKFLKELCLKDKSLSVACLRYFNPIGAHPSGIIGEEIRKSSRNLIPNIGKVIKHKSKHLTIFGNNYKTKDGTRIRDYIHIIDLVEGHISAIKYAKHNKGWQAINLGTGKGYSVLEVVKTFENILNRKIKVKYVKQRKGDVPISFANNDKAKKLLKWKAKYNLKEMCESFCKWKKLNIK